MKETGESFRTPFLDYYASKRIIPVRQKADLGEDFYTRRSALYRQLGVTRTNIDGHSLLEFGPGVGDNAVHLARWRPSVHVLVDGNPSSLAAIHAKRDSGLLTHCEVHQSDILQYHSERRFDVVLCEGVIPGQINPSQFLRHVASFTGEGGIVVATTVSPESYLAEVCRRALVPLLVDDVNSKTALEVLVDFFRPDLESLPGMSRRHEDWVLDNMLHPWTKFGVFSANEAIQSLASEFSILGMSPHFLQDWRWYKAVSESNEVNAALACREYQDWSLYLLDFRSEPSVKAAAMGRQINSLTTQCMHAHDAIPINPSGSHYRELVSGLQEIAGLIEPLMPVTTRAICSYLSGLKSLLAGNKNADFGDFRAWFGRGQQYVSLVRN